MCWCAPDIDWNLLVALQPGIGHLTDLASLYGVPGSSESESSLSPFDFFGVVWGIVAGVVLSGILPTFLLLVESFLVLDVDDCGLSEHAVCALVW